jgi:pSer/pThr/pTyr-binding forkhead associated (FHA) protein
VREAGPGTIGETWILPRMDLRVGRSSSCFIALSDGKVSRAHTLLSVGEHGVNVSDLDSGNGTYVNEVQVASSPAALSAGDRLRVGDTVLVLKESGH